MARNEGSAMTSNEALQLLIKELQARRLIVILDLNRSAVVVSNPATAGTAEDERYQLRPLSQVVHCGPDADGALMFWWVWGGGRGGFEREPLLPATHIPEAADKILKVLAPAPGHDDR